MKEYQELLNKKNADSIIDFWKDSAIRTIVRLNPEKLQNKRIPILYEIKILTPTKYNNIYVCLINGQMFYIGLDLEELTRSEEYKEFLIKEIILKGTERINSFIEGEETKETGFYLGTIKDGENGLEVIFEEDVINEATGTKDYIEFKHRNSKKSKQKSVQMSLSEMEALNKALKAAVDLIENIDSMGNKTKTSHK